MLVLGMDCSVEQLSVALVDDQQLLAERKFVGSRGHVEVFPELLSDVLAQAHVTAADLHRIGVGVGPGSFTGIRIALAAARGFGLALNIPVCGVTSTMALASGYVGSFPLLVAIDAHKGQIYGQWFSQQHQPSSDLFVCAPHQLALPEGHHQLNVIGNGAQAITKLIPSRFAEVTKQTAPEAFEIARIVGKQSSEWILPPRPIYLRQPDAKTEAERQK